MALVANRVSNQHAASIRKHCRLAFSGSLPPSVTLDTCGPPTIPVLSIAQLDEDRSAKLYNRERTTNYRVKSDV